MNGICYIRIGGDNLDKLKSALNILFGLGAVIFVGAFKMFFLATSVFAIIVIGYSFINCLLYMNSGLDKEICMCFMTICLSSVYLHFTVKLGTGMYDILMCVHQISGLMKPKNSSGATSGGSNTVIGSKGVFKR